MQWTLINEKLPEIDEDVLIMWRYREGSVWSYSITTYRPYGKNGNRKKFPFGNTFEIKAWCSIPENPFCEAYYLR